MSETYNAHIFRRRKVGEREEVRMRLFGEDGSPLEIPTGPIPSGPNPLDVPYTAIDMSPAFPIMQYDCVGRTAVHVRRLTIPSNASVSKQIQLVFNNLEIGTPYQFTIQNASASPHIVILYLNGNPTTFLAAGQGSQNSIVVPSDQWCSIMGVFTKSPDQSIAVVTQPGSRAIRRVTGSYVLDMDYDINPMIFVNSTGPATITLRDLNNANAYWSGEETEIYQEGAGAVTIAAPAGGTITRPGGATGSFVMPGRYTTVKLRAVGVPKWAVVYYTPATGL